MGTETRNVHKQSNATIIRGLVKSLVHAHRRADVDTHAVLLFLRPVARCGTNTGRGYLLGFLAWFIISQSYLLTTQALY